MISHSPYAPVNEWHPEPPGKCDRCSFKWPLAKLGWQMRWAGDSLTNTRLRVCPTCMDVPQQNGFRTLKIGPDPYPIPDARPFNYQQATQQQPPPTAHGVQFVLDDPDAGLLDEGNFLGAGGAPVPPPVPFSSDFTDDLSDNDFGAGQGGGGPVAAPFNSDFTDDLSDTDLGAGQGGGVVAPFNSDFTDDLSDNEFGAAP